MRWFHVMGAAVVVATLAGPARSETLTKITIGVVPSVPAGATYIAVEKGYFRDAGIEVELENIESAATAIALLAGNRMQVVEGGIAAGYWNALAQGLPVIMALERGSSPLYHDALIRPELKETLKSIGAIKGRPVSIVAPGSSEVYEVGKFLEANGLTLKDVDVKYIPFTQMGVALQNGAVDVAFEVPPFGELMAEQGFGVPWIDTEDWIEPKPVSFIGFLANTDWTSKNPELARKLFLALVRGGRDYCQAYHHGPNRAEVEEIMWKYRAAKDPEMIHRMAWQARDPNGRFNLASVLDLQDWFLKEHLIDQKFPASRLIDASYATYAASQLPPFEVINKESKLRGCR
jgi:NitT/TauT family transport system substrate-binding protein